MIVSAWNNGQHNPSGAGYGLRIGKRNRDRYFEQEWSDVELMLPGRTTPVYVPISDSFWDDCPELRHKKIGQWLRRNDLAPWPAENPPHFELEIEGERRFRLHPPSR